MHFPSEGSWEGVLGSSSVQVKDEAQQKQHGSFGCNYIQFHEAKSGEAVSLSLRSQQCLAESFLFGEDRVLLGPTDMVKPPPRNSGSHGNQLRLPLCIHPSQQACQESHRGFSTHSPPPCRRSCCAGQYAVLGTPPQGSHFVLAGF